MFLSVRVLLSSVIQCFGCGRYRSGTQIHTQNENNNQRLLVFCSYCCLAIFPVPFKHLYLFCHMCISKRPNTAEDNMVFLLNFIEVTLVKILFN